MENKLDIVTIASAVCVAAYAAIAMGYVAQYGLGLSVEQIRGTTLVIAVLIAASVSIDFVGRILGKHK